MYIMHHDGIFVTHHCDDRKRKKTVTLASHFVMFIAFDAPLCWCHLFTGNYQENPLHLTNNLIVSHNINFEQAKNMIDVYIIFCLYHHFFVIKL